MMLNDHIYDTELARFRAGRLPAVRTIEVAEHMEGCLTCRERFELAGARAWTGVPVEPEICFRDDHPDYDQYSEYLDGVLGHEERELIETHVRFCDSCAGDLESLRNFRIESEGAIERRYFESRLLTRLANLHFGILRPVVAFGVLAVILIVVVWLLDSRRAPEAPVVKNPPPTAPEPVRGEQPAGDVKREFTVAVIDGGRKVGLDAGGRLIGFGRLPAGLERDLARVLEGRPLKANPILEELRTPDGVARSAPGEPEPLKLIGPLGTVVRESRPRFRWTTQQGAVAYSVTVTDDRFNLVAESARLDGTTWWPEAALERGRVYQWQVTAYNEGQPLDGQLHQVGLFRVMSSGELAALRKAETGVDSALARAVLYAKAGLIDEAESELGKVRAGDRRTLDRLRRAIISIR